MSAKNIIWALLALGAFFFFSGGGAQTETQAPHPNPPAIAGGVQETQTTPPLVLKTEPEVKQKQVEKPVEIPQLNVETDYLYYPSDGKMNKRLKPHIDEELKNIQKYWPVIYSCSTEYGIDSYNMVGQIYAESHFRDEVINGSVKSKAGAVGISQFLPSTAVAYGLSEGDLKNPEKSINLMCRYMSDKLKKYSFEDALAAYHQGENGLKNNGRGPSELYIQWIKANAELLKNKNLI